MSAPSLYRQAGMPLFQNVTYAGAAEARACATGDIDLWQDPGTGIVCNRAFAPERMVYDPSYDNEQSHSPRFLAHMTEVADLIEAAMGPVPLVEVGCGKGTFLKLMQARGAAITGFDPSYGGTDPAITRAYFSADMRLRAGGLILRHVLEHIADPLGFLAGLAAANGGAGRIYIEVPCLDWILDHRAWFDVFYEHVNYFRLRDFHRIFARLPVARHSFDGQYLSVIAELDSLHPPGPAPQLVWPADFAASIATLPPGGAVWGGASKGVIFALLRQRIGHPVEAVIDINPAKQGRHLPVTGLRVLAPDEAMRLLPAGALIYVMNPTYLPEIRAMTGDRFQLEGLSR